MSLEVIPDLAYWQDQLPLVDDRFEIVEQFHFLRLGATKVKAAQWADHGEFLLEEPTAESSGINDGGAECTVLSVEQVSFADHIDNRRDALLATALADSHATDGVPIRNVQCNTPGRVMRNPWVYALDVAVILDGVGVVGDVLEACRDGLAPEEGVPCLDEVPVNVLWDEVFGLLADDVIEVILRQTVADVVPGGEAEGDELLIPRWVLRVALTPEFGVVSDALGRRADEVERPPSGEPSEVEHLLVDHQ